MNLKSLQDQTLLHKTLELVQKERELLLNLLHHLKEIDTRRLYSGLGYKSLFDFTVRKLGYSEDQAYRRISAMRLLKDLPEIEEKISQGALSLTHINVAQSFFKQEPQISKQDKIQIFEEISHKSIREAERITLSYSTAPHVKPDQIKAVSADMIEMKFQASRELQNKIEKLKGLLAHKNPRLTLGELFDQLCDLGLEEYSPAAIQKRRVRKVLKVKNDLEQSAASKNNQDQKSADVGKNEIRNLSQKPTDQSVSTQKSQSINTQSGSVQSFQNTDSAYSQEVFQKPISHAQLRREVFQRAGNQCENCSSTYALEIDHILPRALGGSSAKSNLRVLCRSCNQRAAIAVFGREKMNRYLHISP